MGTVESIGQSVATIIKAKAKKDDLVVVVSAMSGVTNSLLKATDHAINGDTDKMKKTLEDIRKKHHEAAKELVTDHTFFRDCVSYIDEKIDAMIYYMSEVSSSGELSAKSHDIIVSTGERLSARLLSCTLNSQDVKSSYVNMNKVIPTELTLETNAYWDEVVKIFKKKLTPEVKNNIPVVTGYFGPNPGGILEAVGRGYSDFCAALCGSALKAKEIEIWTDVDGIMSANPKVAKGAKVLEHITFTEAGELSHFGAKVLHPRSIRPALKADIPIRILNTFNPEAPGTVISGKPKTQSCYPFKSITSKEGITVIRICSLRMLLVHGFLAKLFEIFARHEVSVDLVSTAEASLSVTVDQPTSKLRKLIKDLEEIGTIHVMENKAIISVVGEEMSGENYIQGQIMSTLSDNKVKIEMTSVDSSLMNVSVVVDGAKVDKSVKLLHDMFLTHCK